MVNAKTASGFHQLRSIRIAFWVIGLLSGAILSYTTRFFINGDAIAYIEMGEALLKGYPWGLANLTYSPGYPLLLAAGQVILHTNPMNELILLRTVNFFCFVLGMLACESLVASLMRGPDADPEGDGLPPLPDAVLAGLCYGMFLICALLLVRLRLMTPDMLILAILVFAASAVVRIGRGASGYGWYMVLGATLGVGYLVKSFMLPFSVVFLLAAAAVSRGWKRAVSRVGVTVLVMMLVAAPLVAALSYRMGRFSYGELGGLAYALWVSGKGEPVNKPEVLNDRPRVTLYRYPIPSTQPSGHDICFWYIGFGPKIDLGAHFKVIASNGLQVLDQTPWLGLIALWFIFLLTMGSFHWGNLKSPSIHVILVLIAVAGTGFFCLLHMEPRYVAPFFFLGFTGMVTGLRVSLDDAKRRRRVNAACWILGLFFAGLLVHSLVDQSMSGLVSTGRKPCYRDTYMQHVAVKGFLERHGIPTGSEVAVLGRRPPIYWARMAGVTITGEISDPDQFLKASPSDREAAVRAMARAGMKAVVAKDTRVRGLQREGWRLVPGTRDYYVLSLIRRVSRQSVLKGGTQSAD